MGTTGSTVGPCGVDGVDGVDERLEGNHETLGESMSEARGGAGKSRGELGKGEAPAYDWCLGAPG